MDGTFHKWGDEAEEIVLLAVDWTRAHRTRFSQEHWEVLFSAVCLAVLKVTFQTWMPAAVDIAAQRGGMLCVHVFST